MSKLLNRFRNLSIAMKTSITCGITIFLLLLASQIIFGVFQDRLLRGIEISRMEKAEASLNRAQEIQLRILERRMNFNLKILNKILAPIVWNVLDAQSVLETFMEIEDILAIQVDTTDGAYSAAWRSGKTFETGTSIGNMSGLSNAKKKSVNIEFNDEKIGELTVYYTQKNILDSIKQEKDSIMKQMEEERVIVAEKRTNTERLQILTGVVIVIILISSLIGLIHIFVVKDLTQISLMVEDISEGEGDLTKNLPATKKDEIGTLSSYFNLFVSKLRDIIAGLSEQTYSLSSITTQLDANMHQIEGGVNDVSQSISTSSNSLEGISAAITEMGMAIKNMDNQVISGNESFQNITQLAEDGNQAVTSSIDSMRKIEVSSNSIINAISVINDISNQTNLLSLNAAIEAAKAGDSGKGFSVVAEEIRRLASLSNESAQQIQDLSSTASDNVKNGTEIINIAGNSLEKILEGIDKMGDILNELGQASQEINKSIAEIARNTDEISTISQENVDSMQKMTAAINESASTVNDISVSTDAIVDVINKFKIE